MAFCPNCGFNLGGAALTVAGTACPDERSCSWSIHNGGRAWSCAHGAVVHRHPVGWCNGGCCR